MKKSIKFMTAAMAVLALASCSNDDFLSEGQRATVANKGEMVVEVDPLETGVGTRAYRDASDDKFLQFVGTDKIVVYDNQLLSHDIYKSNDEGTKFFIEGKQTIKDGQAAYALFPAPMVKRGYMDYNTGKTYADFIIPEVLVYDENSEYDAEEKGVYYASNLPMFGKVTSTGDGGLKVTGLRHVCAVVKISLENAYTNATYLRLTTGAALDGDVDAKPMSGTFTCALTTDEAERKNVKLEAMEEYDDVKRYPDLYIDLRNVPSPTSVIYIPVVPGLDGDVDDVKLMYTTEDADDPKDIALWDWYDSGCKFPNYEMKQNTLYKAGHSYELTEMSPNKVSQLLEQYKNSKTDIVINVTDKFLIDFEENGTDFVMPKLADDVDVILNLADMKSGVENIPNAPLNIVNADDENPFTGTFAINVGDQVKGVSDVFGFGAINVPEADVILAGNYADQSDLLVFGANSFQIGDGEIATEIAPTSYNFGGIKDFVVATNATATVPTIYFDENIKTVTVEKDGKLIGEVYTDEDAVDAVVNVEGLLKGYLGVYGVKGTVNVAEEGQINGGVDMSLVKKGSLNITTQGKPLGSAGKMIAIQGDVFASCDVNANMAEEGVAVNGYLYMQGAGKKVDLKQGYIKVLNVNVQNAGAWEAKKVDLVFGEGNVAVSAMQVADDNILTYNKSKWNGVTMGEPYVADFRTTQYNMVQNNMFTATQLSVTDAFDQANLQICNDIDMANFKYAGISETTDAAIAVSGKYNADDKKFVYKDAAADQEVFTISNLNYEKIGTGLFNKFAGGTIENLNIDGVKSENNKQATIGSLIGQATGAANIGYVNVTGIALKAQHNIGGLIGTSNGASDIYNCSVAGNIQGGYALGGLVGLVKAAILAEESDATAITFNQDFDSKKTMDIQYAKVGGFFGTVENKAKVEITDGSKAPASLNFDKKAKMYVSDVDESLGNFYSYKANQNFVGYSGHNGTGASVTIAGTSWINGAKYMVPSDFKNTVSSGYKALYTWENK